MPRMEQLRIIKDIKGSHGFKSLCFTTNFNCQYESNVIGLLLKSRYSRMVVVKCAFGLESEVCCHQICGLVSVLPSF